MEQRRRNTHISFERYFILMLVITELSFAAELISNLKHVPDEFFLFTVAGNYLEMVFNTLLLPLYMLYLCEQIPGLKTTLRRKLIAILWSLTGVCIAIILSTAFNSQVFYYDAARVYHRGPLFMVPMALMAIMMGLTEGVLISQRRNIEARNYRSLMLFILAPMIGWVLQSVWFGLPFSLLGITFAALVVFINIQNRNIDKDYLTGAFNRLSMDRYLHYKIKTMKDRKGFTVMVLDVDNFKSINDAYGHFEGDAALIITVRLLREALQHTDFIARCGGDEFCVILNGDTPEIGHQAKQSICKVLTDFNQANRKPYSLSLSMGYACYGPGYDGDERRFLQDVDRLMYEDKTARKKSCCPDSTDC